MLRFISNTNTQSFWFMLDTSYNHGCHLANRFHLESNNYEVLPIVAALESSCRASWLSQYLLSSSHCVDLLLSCHARWLLHCLLPSSSCVTLSYSHSASLLFHQLSSSSCCTSLSSSCRAGWLLHRLRCTTLFSSCHSHRAALSSSRRLFVPPPRCLVMPAGCHIISNRPLIVPPTRPLIMPAGCCVASPCTPL